MFLSQYGRSPISSISMFSALLEILHHSMFHQNWILYHTVLYAAVPCVAHSTATAGCVQVCANHTYISALFKYLQCILPPCIQNGNKHGYDTLPLDAKHYSAMNQTKRKIFKTSIFLSLKCQSGEI